MKEQRRVFDTFAPTPAAANENGPPCRQAGRAAAELSGTCEAALNDLREEFPLLAQAGKSRLPDGPRPPRAIDGHTHPLVMAATFASLGDRTQFLAHAGHALDLGVRQDELKKIVYLTAAHAGLGRAIDAAQALSDLLVERWEASRPIN